VKIWHMPTKAAQTSNNYTHGICLRLCQELQVYNAIHIDKTPNGFRRAQWQASKGWSLRGQLCGQQLLQQLYYAPASSTAAPCADWPPH